ncbi:hypothetical protein F5Y15DRAFT_63933 [Xylariaceae sp. FL0016]|nr:hypothetical protein F5Y15DRAFT_63933 [Xylariaceae sp. FL0016]
MARLNICPACFSLSFGPHSPSHWTCLAWEEACVRKRANEKQIKTITTSSMNSYWLRGNLLQHRRVGQITKPLLAQNSTKTGFEAITTQCSCRCGRAYLFATVSHGPFISKDGSRSSFDRLRIAGIVRAIGFNDGSNQDPQFLRREELPYYLTRIAAENRLRLQDW